jgi:hypothetical protein
LGIEWFLPVVLLLPTRDALNSRSHSICELPSPQVEVKTAFDTRVHARIWRFSFETGDVIRLIAKTKNSPILVRQPAEECCVQYQRMVSIVLNIFTLQRYERIMIIQEDRVALLQDRNTLTMDS